MGNVHQQKYILSTQNIQSPFCTCTEGTGVFLIHDHEVLLLSQATNILSKDALHYGGLESVALSLSGFFVNINLMISKTVQAKMNQTHYN